MNRVIVMLKLLYKYCFSLIVFLSSSLWAVEMQLVSTESDLVSKHLISVKLVRNDTEKAVYKKSLQFSLDDADIVVMQWKSLSEPVTEYIHHLKRTELVFKETTYFELGISEQSKVQKMVEEHSRPLNLFVSCIVLSQHEQAVARTIKVPLISNNTYDAMPLRNYSTSLIINNEASDVLVPYEAVAYAEVSLLSCIESIVGLLEQLKKWLHKNIQFFLYGMVAAFIGAGIIFCCMRRRLFVRRLTGEFLLWLGMLGCNGLLFTVSSWHSAALFFVIAGLCNVGMGWYCLWRGNRSPRLVHSIYVVIACIVMASVLPLFLHALLLLC